MIVRAFQLSDYTAVEKLLKEVLSEQCYEETFVAFKRQLSLDSKLILVAEVDEEIVGLIIGTIDEDLGYYYRIAVAEEYRGQGIGTTMISKLQQRFLTRKVRKIFVTADMHNEPLLPLYESLGFPRDEQSIHRLKIVNG